MAAHSAAKAINTQEITDKARRSLLQLLEAVGLLDAVHMLANANIHLGPRKEESHHRTLARGDDWTVRQVQYPSRIWG